VSGDRELDIVVFGATGFAGRLVAGYLAEHRPAGVRIGLAGRSAQRLADIRAGLSAAAPACGFASEQWGHFRVLRPRRGHCWWLIRRIPRRCCSASKLSR
jgi:nucleoside-diphosphate-sugar epimerase